MPIPLHTIKPTSRSLRIALSCTLLAAAGLATPAMAEYEQNADGWTILRPAADTRFVFVSSSMGNDTNPGTTADRPLRTIARAKQMMHDRSADWMLLKKGDTFRESFGSWNFSGRSESEPVVITTYGEGDERPIVHPPSGRGIQTGYGRTVSHVAIVGIKFLADRPEHESKTGIRWLATGEGLLIEDCVVEGFKDNITIQGTDHYEDVTIRRSVIVDSYSISGHSQGLYTKNVTNILIEENVIDSNGGDETISGAEGSGFDQNVYLQVGVLGAVFRGNITSNAPGAGAQIRSGGVAVDNLFYQNSLGLRFGYAALEWPQEYASGRIEGNVVIGGEYTGPEQGIGLWIERFKDVNIEGNVIANAGDEGVNNVAINLAGYGESFTLHGNVTYNWTNGDTGHSLKSFIRAGDNSVVQENIWSMEQTPKLITIKHPENLRFSSNRAFVADANSTSLFTVDGAAMNFPTWDSQSLTTGEVEGPMTFPDAGRDLGSYARSLGLAGEDEFIEHARSMSRANWDSRFTGSAAARYIRTGYLTGSFADAGDLDQLD